MTENGVQFEVTIDGLDQLSSALIQSPATVVNELSTAVAKSISRVQSYAIKEAPANKQIGLGARLKGSFRTRMLTKLIGEVYSLVPYAAAVETGTRPHLITTNKLHGLANKRTGQFFGRTVHHPGTRPNPFMERAIKDATPEIQSFFSDAIANIFKNIS